MSFVLYVLGAGLLAWSALTLLTSGAFVTIDIAASLAGYGVLAIGLGAVVGALARLGRSIHAAAELQAETRSSVAPAVEEPRQASLVAESVLEAALVKPNPPEPEPATVPRPSRAQGPSMRSEPPASFAPRPAPEPDETEGESKAAEIVAPAPDGDAEKESETPKPPRRTPEERAELRRQRRLQREREASGESFESPAVVAPMLGGGFARARVALSETQRDAHDDAGRLSKLGPAETPGRIPDEASARARDEALAVEEAPAGEPTAKATDPAREPAPEPPPQTEPQPVAESVESPTLPEAHQPERSGSKGSESKAPEPKVPEWLARARARREARARGDVDRVDPPSMQTQPTSEPEPEERPASAPAVEDAPVEIATETPVVDAPEPEIPEEPAATAEPEAAPTPVLLREGEHNGVHYRFYDDGSIEAESPRGLRRFGSVDELRATILAAGGRIEDDPERPELAAEPVPDVVADEPTTPEAPEVVVDAPDRPEGAGSSTPELRPSRADRLGGGEDPFEAALAELEGGGAQEPGGEIRIDPEDRPRRR